MGGDVVSLPARHLARDAVFRHVLRSGKLRRPESHHCSDPRELRNERL